MTTKVITVHLSEDDVEKFLFFREHQNILSPLIEGRMLEMKSGQVVISFLNGTIVQVEKKFVAYKSN